jgi:hypothetical protein
MERRLSIGWVRYEIMQELGHINNAPIGC